MRPIGGGWLPTLGLPLVAILGACGSDAPLATHTAGAASAPAAPPSPVVDTSSPPAPPEQTSPRLVDLPLKPGVYALVGDDGNPAACPPPLAALATFDGQGFGGRNSTDCRFVPEARNGNIWSGQQTCTDTYSKQPRTEDLSITVDSPARFTRVDPYGRATFALCPDEKLRDWEGPGGGEGTGSGSGR